MPLLVQLPDESIWLLGDDGAYHQLDGIGQVFELGYDYSNLEQANELPQAPIGEPLAITDGTPSVQPAPPPPPLDPAAVTVPYITYGPGFTSAPPPPPTASSFTWGVDAAGNPRVWHLGDLPAFLGYLAAHGVNYYTWAANHPTAQAIIEGPPDDPAREPVGHSLGQALAAAIAAGDTPEEAAARTEALRAALVAQGVSGVTRAQLLEDARTLASTLKVAKAEPPPAGQPVIDDGAPPPGRSLQSVSAADRDRANVAGLPGVPQGIPVIRNGLVTEVAVVAAALIEHGDPWLALGTARTESGLTIQRGGNSAGAVGPMQIVGFEPADRWPNEIVFVWANLIAGNRMLANYEAAYNGSQPKVSAAYNAGPGAVNSHWPAVLRYQEILGNPAAGTVQDYVDKVATWADRYRAKFGDGYDFDPDTGELIYGVPFVPAPPPAAEPPTVPAGVAGRWRDLVGVFKTTVPAKREAIQSASDSLIEVFK